MLFRLINHVFFSAMLFASRQCSSDVDHLDFSLSCCLFRRNTLHLQPPEKQKSVCSAVPETGDNTFHLLQNKNFDFHLFRSLQVSSLVSSITETCFLLPSVKIELHFMFSGT